MRRPERGLLSSYEYKQARKRGYVYLIRSPDGLYKIGFSRCPEDRLMYLRVKQPGLELVHEIPAVGPRFLEAKLHRRYAEHRVRGEWFALTPAEVAEFCAWHEDPSKELDPLWVRRPERRWDSAPGLTPERLLAWLSAHPGQAFRLKMKVGPDWTIDGADEVRVSTTHIVVLEKSDEDSRLIGDLYLFSFAEVLELIQVETPPP